MKIKRRVILSLLITITIAILTNKCWLLFNPISVSFGIYGQGKCNVQVLLNKKDNVDFKKIKSAEDSIILTDVSTVDLKVYRAKRPKRLRIILSDMNVTDNIVITNLRVDKFLVSNLADFEVKGAKILIEDKKLVLQPNNAVVMLTYKNPLNVKARIKLDYMIFVTILVLTYLFSYKLTNYVADFKTIQNKSRIDILFLTLFFIFLFIPMSHINDKDISEQENRTLAKWSPLLNDNGELNFNFGKNFNEWFNDRFANRQSFINLHSSVHILLESKCDKGFFDSKNDMLFPKWSFGHIDIDLIKENFKELYDFNNFCQKNNIKFYILIVPQKSDIHPTKFNYINDTFKHDEFLHYIEEVRNEGVLNIIYPYYEMKKSAEQGGLMYFKTEHHWTDAGAFVGYQELMKEIIKDYSDVKMLSKDDFEIFNEKKVRGDFWRDFNYGQDCWRMGIPNFICKKYHQYNYEYYRYKNFDKLDEIVINREYHLGKLYTYNDGAKYRVIQLGTSQNENLSEFIPFTFNSVKRLRNNNVQGIKTSEEFKIMKYYEKEMLDYAPNIIIFCITYNNIPELHKIFNKE